MVRFSYEKMIMNFNQLIDNVNFLKDIKLLYESKTYIFIKKNIFISKTDKVRMINQKINQIKVIFKIFFHYFVILIHPSLQLEF